jgi:tetratricopeptide (TPR) repeat protein
LPVGLLTQPIKKARRIVKAMSNNNLLDEARKERVRDLLNQGRLEEANEVLFDLCREDQRDIEVWSLSVTAKGYLGRYEEVIVDSKKMLEIDPDYLPALNSLASALAALQRYDEAAEKFADLLQIAPDNPSVLNNYGHTLFLMGRLEDARGVFENAVRLQPFYAEAHYNLALLLDQTGNADEALREYEQAAILKPGLPGVNDHIGRLRNSRTG